MRTTTGAGHSIDTREVIGAYKNQVHHDRGLHTGTKTTPDTSHIKDIGTRAGAYKMKVLHGSQREDQEQDEN